MRIFNFLSKKQISEMNLPIFGKVSFDNSTKSQFMQVLYKDDFNLDNNELQIELKLKTIGKNTERIVSELLHGLNEIHDKCKLAFLDDFNNDDSIEYINSVFNRIFLDNEFKAVINNTTREQRLLSALNIYRIQINELDEGFNVVLKYVYGYELAIEFQANEKMKLLSSTMSAGEAAIYSKQHKDWIDKCDNIEVEETCKRFFGENWFSGHLIASYYIYKMAEKIKN
jgi:hypothetical protein